MSFDEDEQNGESDNLEELEDRSENDIPVNLQSIPPVPEFEYFEHEQPRHDRLLHLPPSFDYLPNDQSTRPLPIAFFQLFFTDSILEMLARNTNSYARFNQIDNPTSRAKYWKDTTAAEQKIFFGIII